MIRVIVVDKAIGVMMVRRYGGNWLDCDLLDEYQVPFMRGGGE